MKPPGQWKGIGETIWDTSLSLTEAFRSGLPVSVRLPDTPGPSL